MAQQQPLSSNNPFRRKASVPSAPAAPPAGVPRFTDFDETSGQDPGTEPALPPADLFRHQLQSLSTSTQPPPATSFQKPKVVKKVRVQSPPSSPDSPDVPQRVPPASLAEGDNSSSTSDDAGDRVDPFGYVSSTASDSVSEKEEDDSQQATSTYRTPPNPFDKTLKDLEVGSTEAVQDSGTTSGSRGALDVSAFGRLLLTGQTESAASLQAAASPYTPHTKNPSIPNGDGAATGCAISSSRQSVSDALEAGQETPQTSPETPQPENRGDRRGPLTNAQPSTQTSAQPAPVIPKKKPPPPSSRHGKLITSRAAGLTTESRATAGGVQPPLPSPSRRITTLQPPSPSSPSNSDRPLSSARQRSPSEEVSEKLSEAEIQPGLNIMNPRPPTPPSLSHATVAGTQPSKKPVPPPRRQPHGRSESKSTPDATSMVPHDDTELSLRRLSVDSTRSRSSIVRASIHAPAPPPPRRPSHTSRGSSSHGIPTSNASPEGNEQTSIIGATIVPSPPTMGDTSNSSGTSTPPPAPLLAVAAAAAAAATAATPTTNKPAPPPPPPARNASVRGKRPATRTLPMPLSSPPDAAGLMRRSSAGGNKGKEPPPPPTRNRDRGNSRGSLEGAAAVPAPGGQETTPNLSGSVDSGTAGVESHAGDILADLNALQREVDALRGQVENTG
ncbi:hypothetical protein P885DRAFT_62588 [Corynascus similis CBS 632.67]